MPKKKEVPTLVVGAAVKRYAKDCNEINVGGDFVDGLNSQVAVLIETAVKRAVSNNRKTVRSQDV